MKKLFADKGFYKKLIAVSLPIVAQQLLTASLQLVDNLMVGQLGDYAVGSVSVVNQLYFVIFLISFGAMGGAGIFVSQYFGSKDYDKLKQAFRFKLVIGIALAALSLILFTLSGRFFVSLFSKNPITISSAMDYMSIIRWSLFPWVISLAISTTFREIGITKALLKISIVAVLTNTFLNYLLIFGNFGFPELGVKGAAIATLIARIVEFFLYYLLMTKKGEIFRSKIFKMFRINKTILTAIVLMAIPLTINEFFWSMGQTMFLQAYSTRGDFALASMNITGVISQLVFVAFGGIGTGVAVMVGKTLGENKLKEAKENAIRILYFAVIFAVIMGAILFILSFFILDLYNVTEQTKQIARFNIRINALFIPVISFNITMYFTLRSGGDTRSTLLMDSGFVWLIQVPIIFALSRLTNMPVTLLFLTAQALEVPKMLYAITRFRKEVWIRNLAIHNLENAEKLIAES